LVSRRRVVTPAQAGADRGQGFVGRPFGRPRWGAGRSENRLGDIVDRVVGEFVLSSPEAARADLALCDVGLNGRGLRRS
jgi:hypothetical protein